MSKQSKEPTTTTRSKTRVGSVKRAKTFSKPQANWHFHIDPADFTIIDFISSSDADLTARMPFHYAEFKADRTPDQRKLLQEAEQAGLIMGYNLVTSVSPHDNLWIAVPEAQQQPTQAKKEETSEHEETIAILTDAIRSLNTSISELRQEIRTTTQEGSTADSKDA